MSWSVAMLGTVEKVRAACEQRFEAEAQRYAGKEEEQDINAARDRVLSMLDELDVKPDAWAESGYGASVSSSGSRSNLHTTINIEVKRVILVV